MLGDAKHDEGGKAQPSQGDLDCSGEQCCVRVTMRSGRSLEVVTLHKDLTEVKEQTAGQECSKQKEESEQRPYGGMCLLCSRNCGEQSAKGKRSNQQSKSLEIREGSDMQDTGQGIS